jgi:nitroreductase
LKRRLFLQTLVLALTACGLGTCVQVAIAGYPEIVHEQLNIPEELMTLCGLAVGYSDPDFLANQLRIGRNAGREERGLPRLLADS